MLPYESIGATVLPEGGVRFVLWAPRAKSVAVRLGDDEGDPSFEMTRDDEGYFSRVVPEARAGADYLFVLDGERARPDPASRHQPYGVHRASRVVDPRAYAWTDGAFRGRPLEEYVIYELHVGTFTAAGTFDAAIQRLDHLAALGVTAVEIMPVAECPGGRNWGYDGVDLFAPQSHYGGPSGMQRLVDACHARGLAVVLDVVYNHFGPEGSYWDELGPYTTDKYKTPWGRAINFDDKGSDHVRGFFVENARRWVREMHVDALRLDAVHGIFDFGARHVLSEVAEGAREEARALGRPVYLIAESDLNDPKIVRPEERGGVGLDAQWSDDLHHAVHAAALGAESGYFADFGAIGDVAKALRDGFVIDGARSRYRERRHGAPALDVSPSALVVCLQNHDQVANAYLGKRLAALAEGDLVRAITALFLLGPNTPMLFMGQEWGSTRPFHYFTSHGDRDLAEAVRRGRAEEHGAFGGVAADPQAEATFLESKLDWDAVGQEPHAGVLALHRELLALRRRVPALGAAASRVAAVTSSEAPPWLALRRPHAAGAAIVVVGFGPERARVPLGRVDAPMARVLSTAEARFGGQGEDVSPARLTPGDAVAIEVGPARACVFVA